MNHPENHADPIYLRIFAGFGAWLTAIFILILLGVGGIMDDATGLTATGLLMLVLAVVQQRTVASSPYADQLALALALAGNAALVIGVSMHFRFHDYLLTAVWTQLAVALIGYPLMRDAVFRFLVPLSAAVLMTFWVITHDQYNPLFHLIVAASTLLLGWLWLRRPDNATLRPLAYAAALMVPACLLFLNFIQQQWFFGYFEEPMWPSSLILSALLITLIYHFAGGRDVIRQPWFLLACATTLLLGLFTTPGVLAAASLLILGHHYRDRILFTLAHLFMVAFLYWYYYALNVDLAYKSWVVAASGALLLAARRILIGMEQRRAAQ